MPAGTCGRPCCAEGDRDDEPPAQEARAQPSALKSSSELKGSTRAWPRGGVRFLAGTAHPYAQRAECTQDSIPGCHACPHNPSYNSYASAGGTGGLPSFVANVATRSGPLARGLLPAPKTSRRQGQHRVPSHHSCRGFHMIRPLPHVFHVHSRFGCAGHLASLRSGILT